MVKLNILLSRDNLLVDKQCCICYTIFMTAEQKEIRNKKLARDFRAGLSQAHLSRIYNLDRVTIHRILKRMGVKQ